MGFALCRTTLGALETHWLHSEACIDDYAKIATRFGDDDRIASRLAATRPCVMLGRAIGGLLECFFLARAFRVAARIVASFRYVCPCLAISGIVDSEDMFWS